MASNRPPLTVLVAAQVRAQPRKAALLGVLFMVMVGLYVRIYVRSWTPAEASAEQPISAGMADERWVQDAPEAPPRVTIRRAEPRELPRDPFRIDLSKYPVHRSKDEPGSRSDRAASAVDAVSAEAKSLMLQSILWQADGKAVACIADRMVQPGDEIEGFIVGKVEPTRVLLERDGVRLVLTLR